MKIGTITGVAVVGLMAVVAAVGLVSPGAKPGAAKPSGACTITNGHFVCQATAPSHAPVPRPKPGSRYKAVKATSLLLLASPPFPYPFSIGPAKPWVAGQPAPKPTPILLMQVSAGLATAPASPTATVLLSDWPATGKGMVFVSVYQGDNVDACSSPPLMTKPAAAGAWGDPHEWSATFVGLGVGSYEVQATFSGAKGPMSTPCGRAALKVVPAPGSGQ